MLCMKNYARYAEVYMWKPWLLIHYSELNELKSDGDVKDATLKQLQSARNNRLFTSQKYNSFLPEDVDVSRFQDVDGSIIREFENPNFFVVKKKISPR